MMRTAVLALALAAATLVASAAFPHRIAYACTGAVPDPTEVGPNKIVSGRITNIAYEEQHPTNALQPVPLTVTFEVDRYLKGSGPRTIEFVDSISVVGDTDDINWGGMCGAFAEDPVGTYWVIILPEPGVDPLAGFSAFSVYARYANGLDDSKFVAAIEFVTAQLAAASLQLPSVGNAGLAEGPAQRGAIEANQLLALLAVLALAAAARSIERSPRR